MKTKLGNYEITERVSSEGFVTGEVTWADGTPLTKEEYDAAMAGGSSPHSESRILPAEAHSSGAE